MKTDTNKPESLFEKMAEITRPLTETETNLLTQELSNGVGVETVQEAAKKYVEGSRERSSNYGQVYSAFTNGAKFQKEQDAAKIKNLTEALQKINGVLSKKDKKLGLNPSEHVCLDVAKEALKDAGIDQ